MKKWIPVIIVSALIMGSSAYWFHTRPYDSVRLVEMLPPDRSGYLYLDIGLLRSAGLLDMIAGSQALEDADYKQFVQEAGFDYRTDLNAVAIAFRDGDRYMAAQGRFNWDKLSAYARNHQGSCDQFMCMTPGSIPGRSVSYYMPRADVLAIATSKNATAGDMVAPGTWNNVPKIPTAAIWISAPPYVFTDLSAAPAGTKSFLTPLQKATSTILTVGPGASKDIFELKMEVENDTSEAASQMVKRFTEVTDLFNKMLARDKMQAKSDDISGVLTQGKFAASGKEVTGTWPIPKAFLESLANPKPEPVAQPAAEPEKKAPAKKTRK